MAQTENESKFFCRLCVTVNIITKFGMHFETQQLFCPFPLVLFSSSTCILNNQRECAVPKIMVTFIKSSVATVHHKPVWTRAAESTFK
jgi:hypothetical protein